MTKVINFFGAPSAGKSYNAMTLTCELKRLGYKVEYISEYAKEVVAEESAHKLKHQIYIFAKQLKRMDIYINKGLDFIITDSPLILSSFYGNLYQTSTPLFQELVFENFNKFENINFYLTRSLPYDPTLRVQTEEQAEEVNCQLKTYLQSSNVSFVSLTNNKDTIPTILKYLQEIK